MTTQAAEAKTKRGDGPLAITFIDAANKEHKRVAEGVSQLKVAVKGGKSKVYSVSALSPAVREQLVAEALKKRFDIYVRNTVKDDSAADVLQCTDAVYGMLKEGTLYSRKEGGAGGPGKTFDFERWVTITRNAIANLAKSGGKDKQGNAVKPLTDKQLADVRTKLESMLPKDRTAWIKQRRSNPFFVLAEKEYDAAAAKREIADGDFDANDLF